MTSKIQVDEISDENGDSPVTFPLGVEIPTGYALDAPHLVVNGTLTAGSFVGDGTALTGIEFATVAKTIAFSYIAT